MNGIKCPNCSLVNMMTANECYRCQTSLTDLPPTAEVSVPVEETFQAQEFSQRQNFPGTPGASSIPHDNELGQKTYFWYRVYLAAMTALYALVFVFGLVIAYFSQFENSAQAGENMIMGIVYAVICFPLAIIFGAGLFFPRKSWNWVVGIIYIALGLTSCCLLPATIPLLIFWLKPETQAYLGRKVNG